MAIENYPWDDDPQDEILRLRELLARCKSYVPSCSALFTKLVNELEEK